MENRGICALFKIICTVSGKSSVRRKELYRIHICNYKENPPVIIPEGILFIKIRRFK